ncbi:hypothetical protein EDF24_3115 [Curtobacterium sp. PhB130]|uniref:hypothetical protein n=1 Tax=Curtobacterium sp. PhB130 TaxID=2485178 RepID=UPI000F4B33D9|nr:hypothetical protein [Curtobacterium sp. PhB130]ROS74104.1 hypothetical protein EDF24_3115 [Curtobacterium sp. PhB130]
MHSLRRTAAAALCAAALAVLVSGCTSGAESEPDDSVDRTPSSEIAASGTSPIVFAFVCDVDGSDRTETYTTYSAVWQDERTECRAERITGTEASAQQQAALDAAAGESTLEQLASGCAVTGVSPWTSTIQSASAADTAAGLALYCPGHPQMDHLQDAIAAYRG